MRTTLKVRVIPNARRNEVAGLAPDGVRLKVHAPARDGKANAEMIRFLAQLIDCQKSRIAIKRGDKSRDKIIEIEGASPEIVWRKLELEYDKSAQKQI
jgi:uncharacterized protein (TIGR00251 family)